MIQGQGARGQLTINEKKSGLESLLLFELKSNHLTDCNSKLHAVDFPSFMPPLFLYFVCFTYVLCKFVCNLL